MNCIAVAQHSTKSKRKLKRKLGLEFALEFALAFSKFSSTAWFFVFSAFGGVLL